MVTLSLGCVNLTSLANFPKLPKLQNLLLSDNKNAGDLEALTAAQLHQLTELDLSNNKLPTLASFKPLASLRSLKALHVEANPAEAAVADLPEALFKMIATLQYVDNMDRFGKGKLVMCSMSGQSLQVPFKLVVCFAERPALEEEDEAEDEYEEEVDADVVSAMQQKAFLFHLLWHLHLTASIDTG